MRQYWEPGQEDRSLQDKGLYAFHKKYGYGLRSRVEAQIPRIKRCIGATLLTQKIASQECEGVTIANIKPVEFLWQACLRRKSIVAPQPRDSYPSEQSLHHQPGVDRFAFSNRTGTST